MPPNCACTEIHLDITRQFSKIYFHMGTSESPGFEGLLGLATGKKPVLKSSGEGKSMVWLDDMRLTLLTAIQPSAW